MSKLNPVKKPSPVPALAGGMGAPAARQDAEGLLRRAVMACLLWEDLAYESGLDNAKNIIKLIPQVEPEKVASIAVEARVNQKLRHVPLFIAVQMLKHKNHRPFVKTILPQIITRADQLTDFLALYQKENKLNKKLHKLANAAKQGLAEAFLRFDEYQLAKYDRNTGIKLRDVMFLTHPKPKDGAQAALFKRLAAGELKTPDTWEVALSTTPRVQHAEVWRRLIAERKLGALAYLRNLRNMLRVDLSVQEIEKGLENLSGSMLLPLNFLAAAKEVPELKRGLNNFILRSYENLKKLGGNSIFVVDVSGSMQAKISGKSDFSRMEVASAMAMLAFFQCEHIEIYVTAGSDSALEHKTQLLDNVIKGYTPGFELAQAVMDSKTKMGGGGIFTTQCLRYIKSVTKFKDVERIIVFSDSADCGRGDGKPEPFGKHNYIVDVSAHQRGINYAGKWTAEIAGWSEHFLTYIAALEGVSNQFIEEAV